MESRITLAFVVLSISGGLLYWAWSSANAGATQPPPLTEEDLAEGESLLDFQKLSSFEFDGDLSRREGEPELPLPEAILALDGEMVAIQGHFSPLLDAEDRVKGGQLSRYPGACCFGQLPLITELVWVTLKNPEVLDFVYDGTVLVRGTLKVEIVRNRFGYVEHIYAIEADSIEDRSYTTAK